VPSASIKSSKVYDSGGAAVLAVDHCSLEIEAGEICMIVGPSGCGKTTLLNAIAGFHEITSGRILLDGAVLCQHGKAESGARFGPYRSCFRTVRCSRGRPTWTMSLRPCRAGSV